MMRASIVRPDNTVVVDDLTVFNVDLSSIPSNVHAIQWYDTHGEVELVDNQGRHTQNVAITDFSPYQQYVDTARRMKAEYDASVRVYEANELVTPPTT
jgi:hypothetical protein